MGEIRKKYEEVFKKNAVKLSCASPKAVREIVENLGDPRILILTQHFRFKYGAKQLFRGTYSHKNVITFDYPRTC